MTSRWRPHQPIALATLAGAIVLWAGWGAVAGREAAVGRPAGASAGHAAPSPPRTDTLDAVPPDPRPRAAYGSFAAACDSLERLVRLALRSYADSAVFRRARIPFVYRDDVRLVHYRSGQPAWEMMDRDTAVMVPSLVMTLVTGSDTAPGYAEVQGVLDAAGWASDGMYDADGPNGTRFGVVCREALCVVNANWDSGAPDDTTYVPAPGQSVEITCVPRPPSHPSRRRPAH